MLKKVRTPHNIDAATASFEQSPRRSAVLHSKKLGMSENSVRRILLLDLHFHPYKIQVFQKLEEGDVAKRLVHDRLADCEQRIRGHLEDVTSGMICCVFFCCVMFQDH